MILRRHLHPWDILLSQYVAGMQVFQSSGEKVRIEPVLITTPELIRGDSGDANAITRVTDCLLTKTLATIDREALSRHLYLSLSLSLDCSS